MSIAAWAAPKARSSLEPYSYEAASLGLQGLEIRISHCGLSHSDLHRINDDWWPGRPGHERIRMVRVNPA